MDVATVSIVVSGIVGIGGLAVATHTERVAERRRIRDARDRRYDELREVIDSAAVALISVQEAGPRSEESDLGFAGITLALPRVREALSRVRQQEARLAARVGRESELVERYVAALSAVDSIQSYWASVVGRTTPESKLDEINERARGTLSAFFALASETIGPDRLEGPTSSRRTPGRD